MDRKKIKKLLKDVRHRKVEVCDALEILKSLPFEDMRFAKIDTHRELRKGFPEVIFCQGKTVEQVTRIVEKIFRKDNLVMATKVEPSVFGAIQNVSKDTVYYKTAKIVLIGKKRRLRNKKNILVVSAGTSDLPVAEEAAVTAEILGSPVERLYDVGVAGIHRLLKNNAKLFKANVLIVVAGMEGALASIVTGLVDKPVIAVPTSVGYGASFGGLAALLSMLNCCAPGVAVVNIDNGFGAGYLAGIINRMNLGRSKK